MASSLKIMLEREILVYRDVVGLGLTNFCELFKVVTMCLMLYCISISKNIVLGLILKRCYWGNLKTLIAEESQYSVLSSHHILGEKIYRQIKDKCDICLTGYIKQVL